MFPFVVERIKTESFFNEFFSTIGDRAAMSNFSIRVPSNRSSIFLKYELKSSSLIFPQKTDPIVSLIKTFSIADFPCNKALKLALVEKPNYRVYKLPLQ